MDTINVDYVYMHLSSSVDKPFTSALDKPLSVLSSVPCVSGNNGGVWVPTLTLTVATSEGEEA